MQPELSFAGEQLDALTAPTTEPLENGQISSARFSVLLARLEALTAFSAVRRLRGKGTRGGAGADHICIADLLQSHVARVDPTAIKGCGQTETCD